ncbi:hypothetical protein [Falsiroseomonas sp. E2-1-a20]|uniref:hypothetical protein n=1 Tax=Falsiroseomonas sp. E2-1-a20 TaxID=3239300 RepID=UPI003F38E54E
MPDLMAAPPHATPAIEVQLAGAVVRVAPGFDGEALTAVLRRSGVGGMITLPAGARILIYRIRWSR